MTADALPADVSARPSRAAWLSVVWRHRNGRIGLVFAILVILGSIAGWTHLTPYPPDQLGAGGILTSPSPAHLFGTDQFGRDVFSQVLQALAVTLEIALLAVAISGVIGSIAGIVAGFVRGWPAAIIMRVTDILFAIPAILFALAIVSALGSGVVDSAMAIGIAYVPIFVRVVRGPVLSLYEADFVRAGRVLGYPRHRLLFRHVLPNVAGTIAVQTSLTLAWAILDEAGLSFLGLGPPAPTASLGEMVSNSTSLASHAWWTLAFPSLAIVVAAIAFNFLGDGLRAAFDPRGLSR
ncbi:MAG: ABC transporter permease [Acidimicrobiales bacterium]